MLRKIRADRTYGTGWRAWAGVALACAGGVVLSAGVAGAHDASFPSTTTIRFYDAAAPGGGPSKCEDPSDHDDCFFGKVISALARCESNRVVKVFDREPSNPMRSLGPGAPPQLIGQTKTDSQGRWIVVVDNPGTHTFFARLSRKEISRPGHTHVCRATISEDLEVETDFG